MPTSDQLLTSNAPRRFVILEHTGTASYKPGVHWDLLCEDGEALRAWELLQPIAVLRQRVSALPAHRRLYLDYEGPISQDRGTVRRVAEGTYELLGESPTEWKVKLNGTGIVGELCLALETPESKFWNAVFHPGS